MITTDLAMLYVNKVSENYRLNFQMRANYNYSYDEDEIQALNKPVDEFVAANKESYKVHDYIFKSDQMTPRKIYLLHPLYFIYYTRLVFDISYKLMSNAKSALDFSRKESDMHIYYRGIFIGDYTFDVENEGADPTVSYNYYVHKKQEFVGKPAIKLDLQNFYENISIEHLIKKLRDQLGDIEAVEELEKFFDLCGFHSLPQLHESIASSILSQVYLKDFDDRLEEYLKELEDKGTKITYIRFVDDMFLIFDDEKEIDEKLKNELINEITEYLWSDRLLLNHSKTRVYDPSQFEKEVNDPFKREFVTDKKEDKEFTNTVLTNKSTSARAREVIENGDFITFIKKVQDLYEEKGLDHKGYRDLLLKYIAIPEQDNKGSHSREVLEHIIYFDYWKDCEKEDLEQFVANADYIRLSPFHLTTLYLRINRHLKTNDLISSEQEKGNFFSLYNQITKSKLTFKESVMSIAYQLQNDHAFNEKVFRGIKDEKYGEFVRFCYE